MSKHPDINKLSKLLHEVLLELGEEAGVFKKVSTRYEMPDGSKVFGKNINDNPEKYFTKEVLDKIDEQAKKKFQYGSDEEDAD